VDRRPRPGLAQLRRGQRLQRHGHPADEGRRRSAGPEEQVPGRPGQQPGRAAPATDGAAPHPRAQPADPEGWKVGAQAISRFYRTFDAWFGNKTTPVNGFLEPSPESKFAEVPAFELENIRKNTMIGTPEEIIARIKYYQELGVDEFSFWCDNSLPHAEKKSRWSCSSRKWCRRSPEFPLPESLRDAPAPGPFGLRERAFETCTLRG
jgi:hypothetical protein